MKVESVAIDKLTLDPSNARKHSAKNLEAIKGSLKRFGQQKPIVVGKNGVVIAGNGTLEAARALGWAKIDAHLTDLDGTDATAYALADNRAGELAEWDGVVLGDTLKALQAVDFDLDSIGFDAKDLAAMIATPVPAEGLTDPDDVPENVETRTKAGDVWTLGAHRLMCGDSTNVQHVERLMAGEKAALLFTDPPYGVSYDAEWREASAKDFGGLRKGKVAHDDQADWSAVWPLFDAPIAFVWHADKFSTVVHKSLEDAGYQVRQQIIWLKPFGIMSRASYHWQHEPCWYAVKKGSDANWLGDRKQTTVWDAPPPNHPMAGSKEDRTSHPTQKPIALAEKAILNHASVGGIVTDAFLGSGSTLIACEKTGRKCYGMELDPRYCDVILARWEKFTGKQATRATDG